MPICARGLRHRHRVQRISFYQPSTGNGSIRVMADIGWNLSIGQDWTFMGTQLASSAMCLTRLPARAQQHDLVTVSLFTEQGPIDVAQATLNNSTGAFDIPIVMPTNLPSDAYEFVVDLISRRFPWWPLLHVC